VFDKFTHEYIYKPWGEAPKGPKANDDAQNCERGAIVKQLQVAQDALLKGGDREVCINFLQSINACVTRKFENIADDPSRFLLELFQLFDITFNSRIVRVRPNSEGSVTTQTQESHLLYVPRDAIIMGKELSDFETVTTINPVGFIESTTYMTQGSPPLLVLFLDRYMEDEQVGQRPDRRGYAATNEQLITTPVEVSEQFADKTLAAMVCFESQHVVAFFKFKSNDCTWSWYMYNDSASAQNRVTKIGTLQDVLQRRKFNPRQHGILFFYWDANTNPTSWTEGGV
jgi:hypothetical protein